MMYFGDVLILVKNVHVFLDLSVSIDFGNLSLHHMENTSIQIYWEILLEMWFLYFIAYCQSFLGLTFSTINLYLAGVRHFGIT